MLCVLFVMVMTVIFLTTKINSIPYTKQLSEKLRSARDISEVIAYYVLVLLRSKRKKFPGQKRKSNPVTRMDCLLTQKPLI